MEICGTLIKKKGNKKYLKKRKINKTKKKKKNFTAPTKQSCAESLGNLEPVYATCSTSIEFTLPAAVMTRICGVLVEQVVFLTVNHRGPLPLRELHFTDET